MRQIYSVNGIRVKLEAPDLDGDGKVGGVEKIQRKFDNAQMDVKETTELKDVMDTVFPKRSEGRINMLGNLDKFETANIFKLRSLVNARFLPVFCDNVSNEYLEISVSKEARGRDDARDITIGKLERENESLKNKMASLSGMSK